MKEMVLPIVFVGESHHALERMIRVFNKVLSLEVNFEHWMSPHNPFDIRVRVNYLILLLR